MRIKIQCQDGEFYLERYKVIGPNQYKIDLSDSPEDAGDFDADDYIRELCNYWFGEINEF